MIGDPPSFLRDPLRLRDPRKVTSLQNWCFTGTKTTGSSDNGDYTGYPRSGALYRGATLGYLGEQQSCPRFITWQPRKTHILAMYTLTICAALLGSVLGSCSQENKKCNPPKGKPVDCTSKKTKKVCPLSCPVCVLPAFDCYTKEVWSDEKIKWCCDTCRSAAWRDCGALDCCLRDRATPRPALLLACHTRAAGALPVTLSRPGCAPRAPRGRKTFIYII